MKKELVRAVKKDSARVDLGEEDGKGKEVEQEKKTQSQEKKGKMRKGEAKEKTEDLESGKAGLCLSLREGEILCRQL